MDNNELEYDENGIPLWEKFVAVDPHDAFESFLFNVKNDK